MPGAPAPRGAPAADAAAISAVRAAAENRRRLLAALPAGIVLLRGRDDVVRSHDTHYPFRQDSDFLFLTACDLPRACLLVEPRRATLFVEIADARRRVWQGDLETPDALRRRLAFDRVLPLARLDAELRRVARRRAGRGPAHVRADQLAGWRKSLRKPGPGDPIPIKTLDAALRELRARKTSREIELIQAAARAGDAVFEDIRAAVRPGVMEYELAAHFAYSLARRRLAPSFTATVASGPNSAVLHHTRCDRRLRAGDLVLFDAGAECRGYACDITRTWPVGGRFTRRQAAVYDAVLDAQRAAMASLRPGATLADANRAAREPLARALARLGLLRAQPEAAVADGLLDLFMPHGVSHDLGLDVHDRSPAPPGAKPDDRGRVQTFPLEAGRVLTVEPGCYFMPALLRDPANRKKWRKALDFGRLDDWLDFGGVRIEDDVRLDASGARLLTHAPRERAEIERGG